MVNTFDRIEELYVHLRQFINNRIDAARLTVAEKASLVLSNLLVVIILFIIFFTFLLLASIAFAIYLGEVTGKNYWGFLIVSGIFLVLGITVISFRQRLIRFPIMNRILATIFHEEEHE